MPPRTHAIDDLVSKAIENWWLSCTPAEIRAAVTLSQFAVVARYTTSPSIDTGEALEACAYCRAISDMLARNGYGRVPVPRIAWRPKENELSD